MPKSRAQFTLMRNTAADSRTKIVITLDRLCTTWDETRTDCLSNKGSWLCVIHRWSSVITILVLLSAAVVRIGVNCARFFARLLLFYWYNIYTECHSSSVAIAWMGWNEYERKDSQGRDEKNGEERGRSLGRRGNVGPLFSYELLPPIRPILPLLPVLALKRNGAMLRCQIKRQKKTDPKEPYKNIRRL